RSREDRPGTSLQRMPVSHRLVGEVRNGRCHVVDHVKLVTHGVTLPVPPYRRPVREGESIAMLITDIEARGNPHTACAGRKLRRTRESLDRCRILLERREIHVLLPVDVKLPGGTTAGRNFRDAYETVPYDSCHRRNVKHSPVYSGFEPPGAHLVPLHFRHASPPSASRSELLTAQSVQFTLLCCGVCTRHLLRWSVLEVADSDQGQEPVQMPVLALERNVQRDHPVVDQLCCDDLPSGSWSIPLIEPGRRHLGVYVLVDFVEFQGPQPGNDIVWRRIAESHHADVIQDVLVRQRLRAQERDFVFRLPF